MNDTDPPNEYDLYDTLSHLLRRSHFFAEALFSRHLKRHGITSRQLALLVALARVPGASQKAMGEMIALDMNTVSDLLKRMEARGFVERRRSEKDRRTILLWLSDKGRLVLGKMHDDNAEYQDALTMNLTSSEAAELKRLLRKVLTLPT